LTNVELQAYRLSQPLDLSNIAQSQQEISAAATQPAGAPSGTVTDVPRRIEVRRLPGFSIRDIRVIS
jgi:hypothetical protein